MTNLSSFPLVDAFETTLSQAWNGAVGTIYVSSVPGFTFPAGVTTYIVVDPGKTTMQLAKIDSYDSTALTMNVTSITLKKGASLSYTQQSHSVGAKVIISDNYQFWEDIYTAINTKIDGRVQGVYFYADSTARDADLGATPATNGLIAGLTSEGKITYSLGGSWMDWSTTSATFVNASTAAKGAIELPTDAEVTAGTATGGTGATLAPTNAQTIKSISLKAAATAIADANEFGVNVSAVDKRIPASVVSAYIRGQNLVAGENLTANDLVHVESDGKAYKTIKKATTSAQIGTITGVDSSTTEEMIQVEYLTDDLAVVAYKKSADDKMYASIVSFARGVITVGTEKNISADVLQAASSFTICVLTSSLFVISYRKTSDNIFYSVACTVSGTTITTGSATSMSATAGAAVALCSLGSCKVSATKFLIIGHGTTSDRPIAICGSISGTTITAGATSTVEAVTMASGGVCRAVYIQDDVVFVGYDDATNMRVVALTISTTTITVKTPAALAAGNFVSGDRFIYLGNGTFIVIRNSTQFIVYTLNIADQTSWTVATAGTPLYNVNNDTANSSYAQAAYLGNNILAIANQTVGPSDIRIRTFTINNNGLAPLSDVTVAATAGETSLCKLNSLSNKVLVVWRETGTTNANFSIYQDTSSQYIGTVQTTTAAAGSAPISFTGLAVNSGMTAGAPQFVGDAGAVAASGTKQIGVALSATSLLLV